MKNFFSLTDLRCFFSLIQKHMLRLDITEGNQDFLSWIIMSDF